MPPRLVSLKVLATDPDRPWATERRLRRYVSEHRIPHYKIDGRIYFDPNDVDAHAQAGRVEAV